MMKNCTLLIWMVFFIPFIKAQEGGYSDKMSVKQGDDISFFINTKLSTYTLTIYRFEDTLITVETIPNLAGGERTVPDSAYLAGCNWPLSYKLTVPLDWTPGAYRASFKTSVNTYSIVFFVRAQIPGNYSKVLFVASTNTWQAYNSYGGKSLYDYNSTDRVRSVKVSTQRPSQRSSGYAEFIRSERLFIRWMYNNEIVSDYATEYDLHVDPDYLSNYKIVFIVGHSEYWSYPQRTQVEKFIRNGGKVIILSGNTCWWQIRFEDSGKTIVCYKDTLTDPIRGINDSLITYNWSFPPINNNESKFLGSSFIFGGYVNNGEVFPASQGYGDYAAFNSWHWVYKNTGLSEGEEFGYDERIVGNEVDGVPILWTNGVPTVSDINSSPGNLRILGVSPASTEYSRNPVPNGIMGLYFSPSGGAVFNSGTINFSAGLQNYFVSTILRNVYNKFYHNRIPPEINSWSPAQVIPFTSNNLPVFINKREYLYKTSQNIDLKLSASEPLKRNLSYKWLVNGVLQGHDTLFNFNYNANTELKATIVKAIVSNSDDSSELSWKFFNSELAFSETPPAIAFRNSIYKWRVQVFNYYNDKLQYVFSGPSWLSFNNEFIEGKIPDSIGNYNVKLIVKNSHNQTDELNFVLNVTDQTLVEPNIPQDIVLYQNYPNPFNPETNIKYAVNTSGIVSLKVFDITGREIAVLINEYKETGVYNISFNGIGLASGVYFYRLSVGQKMETKKLIIVR